MINFNSSTFILRIAVSIILIMHSIPGMFNNGIHDFGDLYLNQNGFAPLGIPVAWTIKLSHVGAVYCLIVDKYLKWAVWITIFILVVGIFMVHLPDGWYVVGGGRNGIEFNFLLIAALLTILYPNGLSKKSA